MQTTPLAVRAPLLPSLVVVAALATAACASPTGAPDAEGDVVVATGTDELAPAWSPPVHRPDFVALAYSNHAGCRDGAGKFHYRFYLTNKGNAAGVVPMTKIHISVPWSDNDALLDYTTYIYNTPVAVGEMKLVDIVIPYANVYPTTYEAVVQPDVAKVVAEFDESNNDFTKNTAFWNGLQQSSNCL